MPATISAMIAFGSSPRGLSLVTMIRSAWREATAPMSGRLPRSGRRRSRRRYTGALGRPRPRRPAPARLCRAHRGNARIDHHQGPPAAADALEAPVYGNQSGERAGGLREGHARNHHRREHAQQVRDIEASEQCAFDARFAPGTLCGEVDALRGHADVMRFDEMLQAGVRRHALEAAVAGPGHRTAASMRAMLTPCTSSMLSTACRRPGERNNCCLARAHSPPCRRGNRDGPRQIGEQRRAEYHAVDSTWSRPIEDTSIDTPCALHQAAGAASDGSPPHRAWYSDPARAPRGPRLGNLCRASRPPRCARRTRRRPGPATGCMRSCHWSR